MRRRWLYARYLLPWFVFRWLLPRSESARSVQILDWRYLRWRRRRPAARVSVGPQRIPAPEPTHVCWPVCQCPDVEEDTAPLSLAEVQGACPCWVEGVVPAELAGASP